MKIEGCDIVYSYVKAWEVHKRTDIELTSYVECKEEIKGGIGNDTLTTIRKGRTIKFKVSDPVTKLDIQLAKLGAELKNGSVLAWHFDKAYTVATNLTKKEVTLDEIPSDISKVIIYNTKTKKALVPTTDYVITGNKVEVKAVDILANDNIYVGAFEYEKLADYADISNKPLPSSYTLIIRKPLFNLDEQIVAYKQYFFPKAKMSGSFTLKGATEKTKNVEDTEFTIEKDINYDYLGRIMFIKEGEV